MKHGHSQTQLRQKWGKQSLTKQLTFLFFSFHLTCNSVPNSLHSASPSESIHKVAPILAGLLWGYPSTAPRLYIPPDSKGCLSLPLFPNYSQGKVLPESFCISSRKNSDQSVLSLATTGWFAWNSSLDSDTEANRPVSCSELPPGSSKTSWQFTQSRHDV